MKNAVKLILALAAILILAALCFFLVRSVTDVLTGADLSAAEPDPMFETAPETVTRPPELYPEETQTPRKTLDDYVPGIESPVDKTADELIAEAEQAEAAS